MVIFVGFTTFFFSKKGSKLYLSILPPFILGITLCLFQAAGYEGKEENKCIGLVSNWIPHQGPGLGVQDQYCSAQFSALFWCQTEKYPWLCDRHACARTHTHTLSDTHTYSFSFSFSFSAHTRT